MGQGATNYPPIPSTIRDVQGRGFLLWSPQLDTKYTGEQAYKRRNQRHHFYIAPSLRIIDVTQRRHIRIRRDRHAFVLAHSP